jgi:hypothetical protein
MEKPPKYVKIINSDCCLILSGDKYYRAAGQWEVGFRLSEDGLVAIPVCFNTNHLDGVQLVEVTREEWKKSNAGYIGKEDKDE